MRRLGRGGMGVVWHAVDEVLGREVAVKELRTYTDTAAGELADLRLRMTREARAAARVRHPGVVAVHDVTEHEGRPVIVMELVDGPSLDDVLKESGALEPYEAARIGAGVLEALAAAHDAGVLHRDVKPGNILLDRSGRTVLTDFGIAAMEDPDDGSATRLTRSGEIIGSLDFLAPERARGQDPAPAADVWAVGATLYAAVEGASPFRRTSTWSTLAAIVADPLPEPRRSGPLTPVLLRLLDKDPAARPDAREAARLLAELAASAPPPPDPRLPAPAPAPATGAGESFVPVPGEPPAPVPAPVPDVAPGPLPGFGPPVPPAVASAAAPPAGGDPAAVTRPAPGGRAARRADRGRKGGRANAVVAASVVAVLLAGGGITYALMDRDDSARASGERSGDTGADAASGAAGEPGHVLEPGSGTGTVPASAPPGTAPSATGPDGSAAPSGDAGGTASSGGASRDGAGRGEGDGGTGTGSGGSSGATTTSGAGGTDTGSGTGSGADGASGGGAVTGDGSAASSGGSGTSGGSTGSGGSGSSAGGATAPAGATTAAPDPTTRPPAPAGCAAGGSGTVCQVVSAGVTRRHDGGEMGTIGTGPHTFFCQVDLDHSETSGGVSSRWFARTDDDSGNTNVYFSVLHLGGGGSGGPVEGLRIC
ncbi:serine/threonine-protein kinase [Streptomyces griseus]|uniref:serine/threonine-protein kinase n=1 Tax=Streptomyces griseus TaxID=1911 RepID=UPI002D21A81C|nr:serine/threonine-protein kinase [Streptomyces griseus]